MTITQLINNNFTFAKSNNAPAPPFRRVQTPQNLFPITGDVVYFKNDSLVKKASTHGLSLEDFMAKMENAYPNKNLSEAFKQISAEDENLLGEGISARAYSIPEVGEYVLRIEKYDMNNNRNVFSSKLQNVEDFSSKYNYGQPVATNGEGLFVLKKVAGKDHSYHHWGKTYSKVFLLGGKLTEQEALENFKQIKEVAQFPLISYVDLAKKTEFLNHSKKKLDIINPNNLMVDTKRKVFSMIDLWDDSYACGYCYQGSDHMISLVCDPTMNLETMKVLPEKEREEFVLATKTIIKKCKKAGEIVGLNRSQNEAMGVYEKITARRQRTQGIDLKFPEKYEKFAKFYADVL